MVSERYSSFNEKFYSEAKDQRYRKRQTVRPWVHAPRACLDMSRHITSAVKRDFKQIL